MLNVSPCLTSFLARHDDFAPVSLRTSRMESGSGLPAWRARYQTQEEYEAEGIAVTQAALAEYGPLWPAHARCQARLHVRSPCV
jgi:hypothetical protein